MAATIISFKVDELERQIIASPETLLVDVLRNDLSLTGVRTGCREGGCGSCSVLIDDVLKLSCQVPIERVKGRSVRTIHSLAEGLEVMSPLQQAFIDNGATQCGFCTSGMIISAQALLSSNPNPTRDEVIEGISGNICRCTGYDVIVDAILDAAQRLNK